MWRVVMIAKKMMQRKKWISRDVKLVTCRREVITSPSPTGVAGGPTMMKKARKRWKLSRSSLIERLAYHIIRGDMIYISLKLISWIRGALFISFMSYIWCQISYEWTNGPMDQWTNGPIMDQRTNGPRDQWTNGSMDQGKNILEHWKIGAFEYLNI